MAYSGDTAQLLKKDKDVRTKNEGRCEKNYYTAGPPCSWVSPNADHVLCYQPQSNESENAEPKNIDSQLWDFRIRGLWYLWQVQ